MYKYNCFILHQTNTNIATKFFSTALDDTFLRIFKTKKCLKWENPYNVQSQLKYMPATINKTIHFLQLLQLKLVFY